MTVAGFLAALVPFAVALGAPSTLVATAVPAGHGAQHPALTLRATFELQCGHAAAVTVGLPKAMGVRTIRPAALLVNGVHPVSVRTSNHVVAATMPPPAGMICNSIAPARITVRFTGAGLVNPAKRGSYAMWLRVRGQTAAGRLRIN